MSDVVINREPVELYKVLKFEGLVGSGGEAKLVIGNGLVQLNGQVETRKRKKVVAGDVIEFNEVQMTLVLAPST
jgi:ribosome-associated protein